MSKVKTFFIFLAPLSAAYFAIVELGLFSTEDAPGYIEWSAVIVLLVSNFGHAILTLIELDRKKRNQESDVNVVMKETLNIAAYFFGLLCTTEFRANVFQSAKGSNQIEIKFNSSNMNGALDQGIHLEKWQGCTGHAWGYGDITIADMTVPDIKGGATWGMTPDLIQITKNLGAIISIPVSHPRNTNQMIAILSFDTTEAIADQLIQDHVRTTLSNIAGTVGRILESFGLDEPLENDLVSKRLS
ncbi:MAG: hypothetical protein JXA42_22590 [Anaerolineales bacterium]|nr:hypothetical protein [Anaerolineales bacterium]